jgi:hypothetical protein
LVVLVLDVDGIGWSVSVNLLNKFIDVIGGRMTAFCFAWTWTMEEFGWVWIEGWDEDGTLSGMEANGVDILDYYLSNV